MQDINSDLTAKEFIRKALEGVFFIVEANSNEQHYIWKEWHNRIGWKQITEGFWQQIGEIDSRPVCISISFAELNGKMIAFYYGSSEIVDHKMIEDLLREVFPIKHDSGTRWSHVDGMNFHNCYHAIMNS